MQAEADIRGQLDSNWTYEESVDEITGAKTMMASTSSVNVLEFDFPYDGGSTGDLTIWKTGEKLDIYLKISNGHFLTSYKWNRTLEVKFDNENTMKCAYGSPSNYRSNVIFLDQATRLLAQLQKAKQVNIKVDFYNDSSQVLTFNTGGLNFK